MRGHGPARLAALALAPWLAAANEPPLLSALESCLAESSPVAQLECLAGLWTEPPSEPEALEPLLEHHPELLDALAARWLELLPSGAHRARAGAWEWRAQALGRLGRADEAAQAWQKSLLADDQTSRLVWLDLQGGERGTLAVGAGEGRLVRAAGALLDLGRKAEALRYLRQLAALGALEPARRLALRAGFGEKELGLEVRERWTAPRWFPPAPPLEIRTLDGDSIQLAALRGHVVLLDFWASWCAPCLKELPQLQRLYEAERARGFVAITINAQEPAAVARRTAQALGLELPIGVYDGAVDDAFRVRQLPTVILVDRLGRIRERWNGYARGLEQRIAARVRALIEEGPEQDSVELARVFVGEGLGRVRWWRELPAAPLGLAVVRAEDGTARIAAATPRRVLALDASGRFLGGIEIGPGGGRLVRASGAGGGPWLATAPPGSRAVVLLDPRSGATREWKAPAAVTDLQPAGEGHVWVATLAGTFALAVPDLEARLVCDGPALAAAGLGTSVLVLDQDGKLRECSAHGGQGTTAPRGTWRLAVADGEIVSIPAEVTSWARVSCRGRTSLALADREGWILLVEPRTRQLVLRAQWPQARELGAGDLDGDGCEELLVGFGHALAAVEWIRPAASGVSAESVDRR